MFKSILVLIILSLFLGIAAWLLFIWMVKKGAFDDVEGPKYRMLEDDDVVDIREQDKNKDTGNQNP